jgi:hypothetical protein
MNLSSRIALWRMELSDVKTTLHPNGKRYSDAQFIAWENQARLLAYQYRPQWYQKTVVLKLASGSVQNTCDCNLFYAIDGLSDANGNIIAPLTPSDAAADDFFGKAKCTPCIDGNSSAITGTTTPACGKPTSYQFDPQVPSRFTVEPAICVGADYYIRAICANPPAPCCADDADCCLNINEYPVIQWYVKSMAMSVSKESQSSQRLAQEYLSIFYKMLGVTRSAEREYLKESKAAV